VQGEPDVTSFEADFTGYFYMGLWTATPIQDDYGSVAASLDWFEGCYCGFLIKTSEVHCGFLLGYRAF
jgi:hypothetical protein